MSEKVDIPNNYLIPEKHPQYDLFICDVADAVIKDLMPQMEHPFYSLSKKPDTTIRRYEHGDNWIEIVPNVKGAATIYDKDILIYAVSQLMAKLNRGEEVTKRVRINSHELLMFTNRGTSGRDYMALQDSLDRLDGTRIRTNIQTGDETEWEAFGLVEGASTRRKNGLDGRLLWCELTLSDWVFDAIRNKTVLTLNRDYFRLRKPIERRIYEIGRKHCGQQKMWSVSLAILHHKSGSKSSLKEFRRAVKNIVEHNHLPDYTLTLDKENDAVTYKNRTQWWDKSLSEAKNAPTITDPEAYNTARTFAPKGIDIYQLEQDWLTHWLDTGCKHIAHPELAFIGFVKGRFSKA